MKYHRAIIRSLRPNLVHTYCVSKPLNLVDHDIHFVRSGLPGSALFQHFGGDLQTSLVWILTVPPEHLRDRLIIF